MFRVFGCWESSSRGWICKDTTSIKPSTPGSCYPPPLASCDPWCAPDPGYKWAPSSLQNASVSITRCNLLSDIRVTLWLDYPLIIRASFYPESPLCRDYPRCHDLTSVPRAERGVMVSQSEASVQASLTNKRTGICYKQTFLSWRVNTAKGLQQDRVHYRIQMRGELKIRNVNMGLVTLIRYS